MSERESELNPSAIMAPPSLPAPLSQPPPLPVTAPAGPLKIHPGFWRSVVLAAIFYSFTLALAIVVECLKRFAKWEIDGATALLVEQLVAWPLTFWIGLNWCEVRFREACPVKPFAVQTVPALMVTCFGLALVLNAVAGLIPMPELIKKGMMEIFDSRNKPMLFLATVVVAPVAEELFFRGLILRGYLGRYSILMAVWFSAFMFALYHLNPWQGVGALPLGLLFAWLFLRTGSVLPGIVGHATANFTACFLMIPMGAIFGYDEEAMKEMETVPMPMVVIGVIATCVGGWVLWRQMRGVTTTPGDGGEVAVVAVEG